MLLNKRLLMMLGVGAGAFLFTLALTQTEFFEAVEARSHDVRVRSLHDQAPPSEAVLVLVDENTLEFFKKEFDVRWPFNRGAYCPVLRFLKASGAKAVAFDIQFSEPDPMGDDEFAECIAEAGFVVLGYQCHAKGDGPPAPRGRWSVAPNGPGDHGAWICRLAEPQGRPSRAAASGGGLRPGPDGGHPDRKACGAQGRG